MDNQGKVTQNSWKPSSAGCFKLNVDAATKLDKQISGFGAISRDATGSVLVAAIKVSAFFFFFRCSPGRGRSYGMGSASCWKCRAITFDY